MVQLISELNKVNGYSYDDSWKLPTFSVIISILTAFKPDMERQGGYPARFVCHNQTSPRLGSISNVSVNTPMPRSSKKFLHSSGSLSRNSPSYEEKRTDNTPDGGWAEQWNYWITSTVPQLSLISWPEVWHVSRPAPPQSWYPVMLSSQPEIQFLSGHVRVGSEGWPPIWEVGFQWLSGGWRPSGKTGDQTRGRWGWKVSRRREILISTPSGTSALLQTWSKCFLIAVSFMTPQQYIKTVK